MSGDILKKAQLEIMQTVMILFFVIILLIGAVVMVTVHQGYKYSAKTSDYEILGTLRADQTMNFLPEIQCSKENVVMKDCFDMYKVRTFLDVASENQLYYATLLGNANATLSVFEPGKGWSTPVTLYDNPVEEYTSITRMMRPITVYNPVSDKTYFGKLEVTYFR
jgi:hypothetical protein